MSISLSVSASVDVIEAGALPLVAGLFLAEKSYTSAGENYASHLRPFLLWWEAHGPPVLSRERLAAFYQWISTDWRTVNGSPPAPSTVHTVCRRVRQLLRWCHQTGRLPLDVSGWMPLPPAPTHDVRFLSLAELQEILSSIPPGTLRLRDLGLFAFLLGTGARRMEAAAALVQNLSIDADLSGGHCIFEARATKTKRRRVVVFGPATAQALHYHLLYKRLIGNTDPHLFAMSNTAIRLRFQRWATAADVPVSSHDFRRAWADYFLEHSPSDISWLLMKLQLGHSVKKDMTAHHYLNLDNTERVIQHLRAGYVSPVEALAFPGI